MLSDSERNPLATLFLGLPGHVGFNAYYQAGVDLALSQAVATKVSVFLSPAKPTTSEAMETGASSTSSLSLVDAPSALEGDYAPDESDGGELLG